MSNENIKKFVSHTITSSSTSSSTSSKKQENRSEEQLKYYKLKDSLDATFNKIEELEEKISGLTKKDEDESQTNQVQAYSRQIEELMLTLRGFQEEVVIIQKKLHHKMESLKASILIIKSTINREENFDSMCELLKSEATILETASYIYFGSEHVKIEDLKEILPRFENKQKRYFIKFEKLKKLLENIGIRVSQLERQDKQLNQKRSSEKSAPIL